MFKSIQNGGFFPRSGKIVRREGTMYERSFLPMLVFQKGTKLGKVTYWFCSTLRGVHINFIQIMRTGIIDKFKCYGIHALMHPFIDRQPVNWLKLFAGYMMFLSGFKQNRINLFCGICIFFFSFSLRLECHAEQA